MTAPKPYQRYVICETVAAITPHVRRVGEGLPAVRHGGHSDPKPFALCGTPIAWDTRIPVNADTIRCVRCLVAWRREAQP